MALYLEINPLNPDHRLITQVVGCLQNGGIAIIPTDSVYAMIADLENYKAMKRLCEIIGAKPNKSQLSILCNDLSTVSNFTLPIQNSVFRLLKHNLPGPFTFILRANKQVPNLFHFKRKSIGIRIPDHLIVSRIVAELGHPVISTSIHSEDEVVEYTPEPYDIFTRFENKVDLFVDGGIGGIEPTTVIDCSNSEPEVTRQGKGVLK